MPLVFECPRPNLVSQAEEEMRQKMALIQQIRAMEATPVIRHKLVDLTEKAGHGLLSEMSIGEVRQMSYKCLYFTQGILLIP